ncbi:hypothetical protein HAX54_006747, partial [Datura stramonium]|nr:hypothetical protein [Datura stramonium]
MPVVEWLRVMECVAEHCLRDVEVMRRHTGNRPKMPRCRGLPQWTAWHATHAARWEGAGAQVAWRGMALVHRMPACLLPSSRAWHGRGTTLGVAHAQRGTLPCAASLDKGPGEILLRALVPGSFEPKSPSLQES